MIVDDEFMAHEVIKGYARLLPNLSFQKSCHDALEALEYLADNEVDLIFLDLNMPKLKGFEFLRTLSSPPQIIVTTAYSEHALEGYELDIVDYLLKPFSLERFLKAVNKILVLPQGESLTKGPNEETIFLTSDKKYYQIKTKDILYLEAAGNYCKVCTTKEHHSTRKKISELIEDLPTDTFIQVHKSFAVAKKHITSIEGNRIHLGEHTVPVGQSYKMNVKELLGSK